MPQMKNEWANIRVHPGMPKPREWKNDELAYCEALIANSGSREVPPAQVSAYLQLQMEDAVRDGYLHAAQAILILLAQWRQRGSWNPGSRL